jgi:hypothetical protein
VLSISCEWMVRPPQGCANGHRLAGHCIVGTTACSCQDRHQSWICDECGDTPTVPRSAWTAACCMARRGSVSRYGEYVAVLGGVHMCCMS